MVKLELSHIHVGVRNKERTLSFYKALGFEVARIPTPKGEYVYIGLNDGSIDPSESTVGTTIIGISVDDVEEVYRLAKGAGVEISDDIKDRPWGVRSFYVKDPDGYTVEFEQKISDEG
jgi:catechol 2,3-dioxygenase-like lactoylglutathione lyase family enzyme